MDMEVSPDSEWAEHLVVGPEVQMPRQDNYEVKECQGYCKFPLKRDMAKLTVLDSNTRTKTNIFYDNRMVSGKLVPVVKGSPCD